MPVHQVDIAEFRADARATVEENAPADVVDELAVPRLIEATLPPEPGEGAVVIGSTGRAFQLFRSAAYHPMEMRWYPALAPGSQHYGFSWGDLLAGHAPLLLVQDTRPEAVQS